MSDDKKDPKRSGSSSEPSAPHEIIEIEWDQALAEWEAELEGGARAESPPISQSENAPAPDSGPAYNVSVDDPSDSWTRIAPVPSELLGLTAIGPHDEPTFPGVSTADTIESAESNERQGSGPLRLSEHESLRPTAAATVATASSGSVNNGSDPSTDLYAKLQETVHTPHVKPTQARGDESQLSRLAALDRGAAAARRTVKAKRVYADTAKYANDDSETRKKRAQLLENLARNTTGATRSSLLCAAAEIFRAARDTARSMELFEAALEAEPRSLIALKSLSELCFASERYSEFVDYQARLLDHDALGTSERVVLAMEAAEVALVYLRDPSRAGDLAQKALVLDSAHFPAILLAASANRALQDEPHYFDALTTVPDSVPNSLRTLLLCEAARGRERRSEYVLALATYERALLSQPNHFGALFGTIRCARALADDARAYDTALVAANALEGTRTRAIVERWAAEFALNKKLSTDLATHAAQSLDWDAMGLRTKTRAERAAGRIEQAIRAATEWSEVAGGVERALALVVRAELHANDTSETGINSIKRALSEAGQSAPELAFVEASRDLLLGRSSPISTRAHGPEDEPLEEALIKAARLLARGETSASTDLLAGALSQDRNESADRGIIELGADCFFEQGEEKAGKMLLERGANQSESEERAFLFFALAAMERDRERNKEWIAAAAQSLPSHPIFSRLSDRLAGLTSADTAQDETNLAGDWRRELALTASEHASDELHSLHVRLGAREAGNVQRSVRLVRQALLEANDPERAVNTLALAGRISRNDALIDELGVRMLERAEDRARVAEERASLEYAAGEKENATRWRALAALEFSTANRPHDAARLYRELLSYAPRKAFEVGADAAELESGELARISDRLLHDIREESDSSTRLSALDALADLDLLERADSTSAAMSRQTLLEQAGGHLPSLRLLETLSMDEGNDETLRAYEAKLATLLSHSEDRFAHARLAFRLLRAGTAEERAKEVLKLVENPVSRDLLEVHPWLARRVIAAALTLENYKTAAAATLSLAHSTEEPSERACLLQEAAEWYARAGLQAEHDRIVREATRVTPEDSSLLVEEGEIAFREQKFEQAADLFVRAAQNARTPRATSELELKAATAFNRAGDEPHAEEAFARAFELDPSSLEAFEGLASRLRAQRKLEALEAALGVRIEHVTQPSELFSLHQEVADLRRARREFDGAKASLRAALSVRPDEVAQLRALSDLCLDTHDWRGAAESLIRLARASKDPDDLFHAFFFLGEIYDLQMPDGTRAEAAYRRALTIRPHDSTVLERLADLFSRSRQASKTIAVLSELAALETDVERKRDVLLRLAQTHESMGDARAAERELEELRKSQPTDLVVIRSMCDFFSRQNSQSAIAMHLSRATTDLRASIADVPEDLVAWTSLVEVQLMRGRRDAARACASAAAAAGAINMDLARLIDVSGGIPGAGEKTMRPETLDHLAPHELPASVRTLFSELGAHFDKVIPFDNRQARELKAEKVALRDHPLRSVIEEAAQWFGIPEVIIFSSTALPVACIPLASSPVTLLVGRELFAQTDVHERNFLVARALFLAKAGLAALARLSEEEGATWIAAVGRLFGGAARPQETIGALSASKIEDYAKKLSRQVPKPLFEALLPNGLELIGLRDFSATQMPFAIKSFGSRAALLATGNTQAALQSLSIADAPHQARRFASASARISAFLAIPEARDLWTFSISDAYFDARTSAELDRA